MDDSDKLTDNTERIEQLREALSQLQHMRTVYQEQNNVLKIVQIDGLIEVVLHCARLHPRG